MFFFPISKSPIWQMKIHYLFELLIVSPHKTFFVLFIYSSIFLLLASRQLKNNEEKLCFSRSQDSLFSLALCENIHYFKRSSISETLIATNPLWSSISHFKSLCFSFFLNIFYNGTEAMYASNKRSENKFNVVIILWTNERLQQLTSNYAVKTFMNLRWHKSLYKTPSFSSFYYSKDEFPPLVKEKTGENNAVYKCSIPPVMFAYFVQYVRIKFRTDMSYVIYKNR